MIIYDLGPRLAARRVLNEPECSEARGGLPDHPHVLQRATEVYRRVLFVADVDRAVRQIHFLLFFLRRLKPFSQYSPIYSTVVFVLSYFGQEGGYCSLSSQKGILCWAKHS